MSFFRSSTCDFLIYITGAFAFFFPKIYRQYVEDMLQLEERHPSLRRNRQDTIFAASSINFGPNAVTYEHTDFGNRANGICPIWCAGDFDYEKGGHLMLRQLKLLIEFPPGSTILIPSAALIHGNVAIQLGESRVSFTQYSAGGLSRWVHYGFKSWEAVQQQDPVLAAREKEEKPIRWKTAIKAFSKVDQLHSDRVAVGLVKCSCTTT